VRTFNNQVDIDFIEEKTTLFKKNIEKTRRISEALI